MDKGCGHIEKGIVLLFVSFTGRRSSVITLLVGGLLLLLLYIGGMQLNVTAFYLAQHKIMKLQDAWIDIIVCATNDISDDFGLLFVSEGSKELANDPVAQLLIM